MVLKPLFSQYFRIFSEVNSDLRLLKLHFRGLVKRHQLSTQHGHAREVSLEQQRSGNRRQKKAEEGLRLAFFTLLYE